MEKQNKDIDLIPNTDINYKELGERIRVKRLLAHLKQNTLGNMVGVNGNHISNIERGESKISLPLVCRLAKVFECSVDELLYGSEISSINQRGYLNISTSFDERMLEDFMHSLKNNKKYLTEDDIS